MSDSYRVQLDELLSMLSYRRPAGSRTEKRFIREHLAPLGVKPDRFGNQILRIGSAPVLWSCHTDTVHRQGGQQVLGRSQDMLCVYDRDSNCLGADDTAGVWIMAQMIREHVPGLYVFHRSEECGGIGSSQIASYTPELLDGIECAIAFDRRGTDSVITHQGGRCCSQAFASALAEEIGLGYAPDSTGVFTDTANYVDLIPECTNVSVGYRGEHSRRETLDAVHLFRLLDSILLLNLESVPIERIAGADDYADLWGDDDKRADRWGAGWSLNSWDRTENDPFSYADRKRDVVQEWEWLESVRKRFKPALDH